MCGFNLLLCEDDDNDVMLFQYAVAEESRTSGIAVEVRVVRDGEGAIEYLCGDGEFGDRAAHPFPDLIVLDLKMPRVSGLEVLKRLEEHPEYWGIPRVMFSGSAQEGDVEKTYKLGAHAYFQKPIDLGEFQELIHLVIGYWGRTLRPRIRQAAEKGERPKVKC